MKNFLYIEGPVNCVNVDDKVHIIGICQNNYIIYDIDTNKFDVNTPKFPVNC